MAPRRSGKGSKSKQRDEYIPASAQGRGDEHPSSIAMSSNGPSNILGMVQVILLGKVT